MKTQDTEENLRITDFTQLSNYQTAIMRYEFETLPINSAAI